jgi:hypothetical protein
METETNKFRIYKTLLDMNVYMNNVKLSGFKIFKFFMIFPKFIYIFLYLFFKVLYEESNISIALKNSVFYCTVYLFSFLLSNYTWEYIIFSHSKCTQI